MRALRQGKRPTKAKARLERGPQSWSFVLNADPLTLSAVKVPGVIKDGTEEQFFERMQLAEELIDIVDASTSRLQHDFIRRGGNRRNARAQ